MAERGGGVGAWWAVVDPDGVRRGALGRNKGDFVVEIAS